MITIYALYTLQTVGFAAAGKDERYQKTFQKQEYRLSGEFQGKERCEQAAKELGLNYKCLDTGKTR